MRKQLEVLCKQLYESQNANRRSEAEKALMTFQNSSDSLDKCQLLMERADSPHLQLLATTTLTKLISRTAQVLSLQQRIDISTSLRTSATIFSRRGWFFKSGCKFRQTSTRYQLLSSPLFLVEKLFLVPEGSQPGRTHL